MVSPAHGQDYALRGRPSVADAAESCIQADLCRGKHTSWQGGECTALPLNTYPSAHAHKCELYAGCGPGDSMALYAETISMPYSGRKVYRGHLRR